MKISQENCNVLQGHTLDSQVILLWQSGNDDVLNSFILISQRVITRLNLNKPVSARDVMASALPTRRLMCLSLFHYIETQLF